MNIHSLFEKSHHPIVLSPSSTGSARELCSYIRNNLAEINDLLRLHSGILFRGFNVSCTSDFAAIVREFGAAPISYLGGNSPRKHLGDDIYTSTEYPCREKISLHNEMSYLPQWPSRLYFHCAVPAVHGGQTTLANASDVLKGMPSSILETLRAKKLCYIRTLQSHDFLGKGWQSTYGTKDRRVAEQQIIEQGSTFTWLENGVLQVKTYCEPFTIHPITGEEVWFNQAEQWHPSALASGMRKLITDAFGSDCFPHDCQYGDGTLISDETIATIRSVLAANSLLFDWKAGDVLALDNMLAMHGREPFEGPRKVHVFLSQ